MVDRCLTIEQNIEKGRFGALFFGLINKSMKKLLIQYLYIFAFAFVILALAYATHTKKEPNPLQKIEEKITEAEEKRSVLTENERKLEQQATEKEWQEVDSTTDK